MKVDQFIAFQCVIFNIRGDNSAVKAEWLYKKIGVLEPTYRLSKTFFLRRYSEELYSSMQSCLGYQDTLSAHPINGSHSAVIELAKTHKVIVLTSRRDDKLYWANEWLVNNEFYPFVDELVSSYQQSKYDVAIDKNCICLVDNDPRHFTLINSPEIKQILYLEDATKGEMDAHYETASSWSEVIRLIQ